MIEAIFFDFNGVIIDDEQLQLQAARTALEPLGIALTEQDYTDALGMDDLTFLRFAFQRAGQTPDAATLRQVLEQKMELHRKSIKDELPLFPGVVTFLKAAARRYQLGLVSMALKDYITHVLERAGLARLFAVVISAEDVTACKPDPACYVAAHARLNEQRRAHGGRQPLAPAACLVIEDAPAGIRSARAAGMRTLGVTNTVAADLLRAAGAEVVTPSLADWTMDAVHHLFD